MISVETKFQFGIFRSKQVVNLLLNLWLQQQCGSVQVISLPKFSSVWYVKSFSKEVDYTSLYYIKNKRKRKKCCFHGYPEAVGESSHAVE